MDKYEYKLKLEQIQNLFAAGDYLTAAEMADTINWKKVRSSTTLCMVGEIYEKTGKYDACREVLLQAYDHSPIGRNIVCQLAEVAIKAKHVDEVLDGEQAAVLGRITRTPVVRKVRTMQITVTTISEMGASLELVWYRMPYMKN